MARTVVPITEVTDVGVTQPAFVTGDATNDHQLPWNDGAVLLEVISTDAGSQTVIFRTTATAQSSGGTLLISDLTVTVPAGATRLVGPFDPTEFNDPATGVVNFDLTVANFRFRAYHI